MSLKKLVLTGATAAALTIGGLAAMTSAASAYVVCNRDGDCWHTENRVVYPGGGYAGTPMTGISTRPGTPTTTGATITPAAVIIAAASGSRSNKIRHAAF